MKRTALITVLFAAFAGLALVGCGSDEKAVPSDAVAVVGDETITKDEFDQLINQAKGSYTQQKRPFPKPGSQEYQALRGQAMQFLVQRAQFEQKAGDFDIKVEDKDVDARLAQLKKQYFKGSEKKYAEQLKQQGLDEDQVKDDIRAQLIQEKIYAEVTKGVEVDDKAIEATYKKNKSQYVQPATRDVRHILVKKKALADSLYSQLQGGASFAALAKKYSQDPSSKGQGGKLTISRGQTVPPFDKAAFSMVNNGDLEAGQNPVRVPHHSAAHLRQEDEDDPAQGRQGSYSPAVGARAEAEEDDRLGRRHQEGLRRRDDLPGRLLAA